MEKLINAEDQEKKVAEDLIADKALSNDGQPIHFIGANFPNRILKPFTTTGILQWSLKIR